MDARITHAAKADKRKLGAYGEQVIANFLIRSGSSVIDRNWRIKEGEIDLVALSPEGIFHFVEVKTRTSLAFGDPLESVDHKKAHRLQRLALAWLATHGHLGCEYQIDCAGVLISQNGMPEVDYRGNVL